MAVKDVVYSKEYLAKCNGRWLKEYTVNDEDSNLRKLLAKEFEISYSEGDLFGNDYDGKMIYNFHLEGYPEKKGKYTTIVFIKKKGDKEVIEKEKCYLEKLLTEDYEFQLENKHKYD